MTIAEYLNIAVQILTIIYLSMEIITKTKEHLNKKNYANVNYKIF